VKVCLVAQMNNYIDKRLAMAPDVSTMSLGLKTGLLGNQLGDGRILDLRLFLGVKPLV
jgi:hypothetical protein